MKLEQCHYLLEVNRLHSISAASQSLHIGQTTLSAIVKRTEEEFGFSIFQRTPTGVDTTPIGERFLELLWEVDMKYEDLLRVKQRDATSVPTIKLLIAPTISFRLALPLAADFSRFDVHGHLVFEELPSELVGEHILKNEGNIGLAYMTRDELETMRRGFQRHSLNAEQLYADELCALVAGSHRLAGRSGLDIQEILSERIASAAPERNDKILGDAILFSSPRISRFSSPDDMCQAVLYQNLVGFAPRFMLEHGAKQAPEGLRLIPLRNTQRENRMYICLLTCKKHNLRYQENILTTCIRDYFQNLNNARETAKGGDLSCGRNTCDT